MDYFKELLALLNIERATDKQAYDELTRSSSIADRRNSGMAWYPVAIRGTELNKAEYITVEIERTTHTDLSHQLRFGTAAKLFSNHDARNNFVEGTITFVSGNRLKISFRTDELPDWSGDGKLGIDLLFDDNSYDEMQAALKLGMALAGTKDGRLIDVLTGKTPPEFNESVAAYSNPDLNEVQQSAVNKILAADDLAIVHGPPGTGKTTTLIQAIKALIAQGEQRILVTAPSNTAVDLLSEKLSAAGLNVLRVGNPARVSERLMALTLDSKIANHSSNKEIKRLKKQAGEFKDMAHKYKRSFGKAEREQRKALFDEAYKILKDVGRMEQYIIDDVTGKAQVVAATLVGANHYTVRNLKYNTVVIDEAGQALEPACWIPVLKGRKLIMAGDHCQLSPTVKSDAAARGGLSTTLMEKCVALFPQSVTLLEEQYRMHATIMGYSSQVFYEHKLRAHESVAAHLLFAKDAPLSFIDTAGCGFEERVENKGVSNPEEATLLYRHLTRLVASLSEKYTPDLFPSIAVISPYKDQLYELKEQLSHIPELLPYMSRIAVNTIDSFQGQERDIVYISMTRSNTDGIIGFLADTRRMNVAMTRARKKLIIVGDSATLSIHPFYADFVTYAEKHGAYNSAWDENWS
jgi:ATP-dependent RNA/DNA helicase IGHMBP2